MDNLETLTASEGAKRIVDGDVSPVALLEACKIADWRRRSLSCSPSSP